MSGKHTPGPWTEDEYAQDTAIRGACGELVAIIPDPQNWRSGVMRMDERVSNARIIAAALDYDDAARKMVAAIGCAPDEVIEGAFGSDVLEALNDLRAAIAKAEGGQ